MTLTKEWLLKTISELEEERDATPGAVNEDAAMALAAMKLALASLTAEPVAYVDPFTLQNFATYRAGETDNKRMGREWMWADSDAGLVPVYVAPPAPVVQDIGEISVGRLPTMNQDDYPGLGDWWVQLRIGKDSDEVLARVYGATPREANSRAEALACRDAMLQGAEPVNKRDDFPFDYLQGQKDGLEWAAQLAEANHPQTGDWLYDDPIELAKAIRKGPDMPEPAGNSPVIPDGWTGSDEANAALIMLDRIETVDSVDDDRIEGIKRIIRALAAAPQQEA